MDHSISIVFGRFAWLMRQIEVVAVAISRMVFDKGDVEYDLREEAGSSTADVLHGRLMELLAQNKIGQAEDLLFAFLEANDRESLALALDFYTRLNRMPDDLLETGGFSREEVLDGLRDAARQFGLCLPGLLT